MELLPQPSQEMLGRLSRFVQALPLSALREQAGYSNHSRGGGSSRRETQLLERIPAKLLSAAIKPQEYTTVNTTPPPSPKIPPSPSPNYANTSSRITRAYLAWLLSVLGAAVSPSIPNSSMTSRISRGFGSMSLGHLAWVTTTGLGDDNWPG
ncbi:hypothetical protein L207DRAFT_536808 [Hyaloscypha variabilis F]|uniref:Uncharacterized protein n=1 Tax=Hyaloscypha variabilis (strain UAMH 11265 / GT02V1 / F) TaxID=1149755 RepID=A0A2J6R011_HYAVF|nr:hypothetical protein L207DRAFT_536808 [Hyaloscypha variabilis F]